MVMNVLKFPDPDSETVRAPTLHPDLDALWYMERELALEIIAAFICSTSLSA